MKKHLCILIAMLLVLLFPAAAGAQGNVHTLCSIDFETLPCFTQDFSAEGWQTIDGDGDATYMIVASRDDTVLREYSFPGCRGPMAFMVFNPDETTPAINPIHSQNYDKLLAHGGKQCAVSFASKTKANDDRLISPAFTAYPKTTLSFFVKGFLDAAGGTTFTESYDVLVQPVGGEAVSVWDGAAPTDAWQEITVDLSAYAGQEIQVVFHYKAQDAFLFMLDDITVTGETMPELSAHTSTMLEMQAGSAGQTLQPALAGVLADHSPAYTFATNNEAVATVDSQGTITPVAEGSATITVTENTLGLSAQVEVTVTAPPIPEPTAPDLRLIFVIAGAVLVVLLIILLIVILRASAKRKKARRRAQQRAAAQRRARQGQPQRRGQPQRQGQRKPQPRKAPPKRPQ